GGGTGATGRTTPVSHTVRRVHRVAADGGQRRPIACVADRRRLRAGRAGRHAGLAEPAARLAPGGRLRPGGAAGRPHRARARGPAMSDEPLMRAPLTNDRPALRIAPPPFLADPAFAALLAVLPQARVVGGAVRDALAERPIADIDLATKLPPTEVMAALHRAGI